MCESLLKDIYAEFLWISIISNLKLLPITSLIICNNISKSDEEETAWKCGKFIQVGCGMPVLPWLNYFPGVFLEETLFIFPLKHYDEGYFCILAWSS
jgi:hypothetical protein